MKIVPLRCPNCGGEIQLDIEREIGFCMYCGGKVMIQDQINKTIKIDESDKIANWKSLGFDSLSQRNIEEVDRYANKIIETDINSAAGWYLKGCVSKGGLQHSIGCWVKAASNSKNDIKMKTLAEDALNNPDKHIIKKRRSILFVREKRISGCVYSAKIFLNGKEIFWIDNGESKSYDVDEGNYTLLIKFGLIKKTFPLIVDKDIMVNMGVDKKTNTFQATVTK